MTIAQIAAKLIITPVKWAIIAYMYLDGLVIRYHGRPSAFNKAVKRATNLHKKTGKRYRVFFIDRRYRVYTRPDIKYKKKAGEFRRYINSTSIDSIKYFDTNDLQPCTLN